MTIYEPLLIADYRTALEKDIDSWLLPLDGYPTLTNAFEYRGRIYKKGGSQFLGRLGVRTQTLATRGAGNTTINTTLAYVPIEPGSLVITDGTTTFTDNGTGGFTISGGTGIVNAPTNYITGAINITFTTANLGAVITANYIVAVNNNSPVMGLRTYDVIDSTATGLIAFDMLYAYQYVNSVSAFQFISYYKGTTNVTTWSGTNYNFFWSTNYQNAFFATNSVAGAPFYTITALTQAASAQVTTSVANNFSVGDVVYFNNVQGMTQINNLQGTVTATGNPFTVNINSTGFSAYTSGGVAWSQTESVTGAGDGIRWYDGTGWVNFAPPLDPPTVAAPRILLGALIILPYKEYLICLNTTEGTSLASGVQFPQRARYSQIGNVYYAPPVPQGISLTPSGEEWLEIPGRGGFIDAPTAQEIVSAQFIKDTLVVFFTNSTYRLTFTNNAAQPFTWEKINTEIGSESTFSTIPFDKEIFTVGSTGIWECDSISMERIDQKIPDQVFDFENDNNGVQRVQGIRDFYNQYCYWTFVDPSYNPNQQIPVFPNSILAYNYRDESWAIFRSYYTCFGYYKVSADLTWGTATNFWSAYDIQWNSPSLQAGFPVVVAGNQQGFVVQYQEVDAEDEPSVNSLNYVVQNISNASPSVITCPNHNFDNNTYIIFENVGGIPSINDVVYRVSPITTITQNTFTILDSDGVPVSVAGYTFGGQIRVVDNFDIRTKKFNPYVSSGRQVRIGYADMFLANTFQGNITAEVYGDEDDVEELASQTVSLTDPNSAVTTKFWTRVYFNVVAQTVSIRLRLTDTVEGQIFDNTVPGNPVILHGMILWVAPAGRWVT